MTQTKPVIAIIAGGPSSEHQVSLLSAYNILQAIDQQKYHPVLLAVDRAGEWHYRADNRLILHPQQADQVKINPDSQTVCLLPDGKAQVFDLDMKKPLFQLTAAFPIIHGPMGEDGNLQGLLNWAGVPFVGPDVLGSAVAMDKAVTKALLDQAGLPVVPYQVVRQGQSLPDWSEITGQLGSPVFIKPCNAGSSIGVSKVKQTPELHPAMKQALKYDQRVLIEQTITGTELECSVWGNDRPQASVVGQVVPRHEFYSYQAKYLDPEGADLLIPASISQSVQQQVQSLAVQAFQALNLTGMARVDFFYQPDTGQLYINELNTLPGFTNISMFPQLCQQTGLSYSQLIDELIHLAISYHQDKNSALQHHAQAYSD